MSRWPAPVRAGCVPDGPDGRRRLSFAGWDAAAEAVAGLFTSLGVTKGDVVCLLLPSSIDYAVCYQAAARIGAVTTGVNLRMGAAEQASIMARVRPVVTVVDTDVVAEESVPPGSGTVMTRGSLAAARDHEGRQRTRSARARQTRMIPSPSCGRAGPPGSPRVRCSTTPTCAPWRRAPTCSRIPATAGCRLCRSPTWAI